MHTPRYRAQDRDRWIESEERGGGFAGLDEPPYDPQGPRYIGAQFRRARRIAQAMHGDAHEDYGYGGYGHMGQGDLYSPGGLGTNAGDAMAYRRFTTPHPTGHAHETDPSTSGRWRGVGPKNYARSDERIFEEVCELLAEADVDASDIDVHVDGGEVTLEGSVHDRWSKRAAEDVVCRARGVKDVHNRLRVSA
jgi:osmotically-inducible protein OsmY